MTLGELHEIILTKTPMVPATPSRTMPVAGGLIAFALVSHSLRPAVAGSVREVRALAREVRASFGARYGV